MITEGGESQYINMCDYVKQYPMSTHDARNGIISMLEI